MRFNRSLVMFSRVAVICNLAAVVTRADVVTHFGKGVGDDSIPFNLNAVGIDPDDPSWENTATTFIAPGPTGVPQNVNFTFLWDTGSFQFSFGFARVGGIPYDPISEREQWATEALSPDRATLVFDDRPHDPIIESDVYSLVGGDELVFFIIPDNTLDEFRKNPSAFYADPSGTGDFRSPLFSLSDANPGEFDQMLSFADAEASMFAFEDLVRTGLSDNNFGDLIFSVNTGIVPEPTTVTLLLAAGAVGLLRRRNRSA